MSDLFVETFGADGSEDSRPPQEEPPRQRSRRRDARAARRRRRRRRRNTAILTVLVLAFVSVGGYFVAYPAVQSFIEARNQVADYTSGQSSETVDVVISEGDSGRAMATKLVDAGVVATEKSFVDAVNANSSSQSIQPGTYRLFKHQSSADAVAALLNANNRVDGGMTIPEGTRSDAIYAKIAKATNSTEAEVKAAAGDATAIGLPAQAGGKVEGWLFPATYRVDDGETPTEVLKQMVDRTVQELETQMVPEAQWETVLTKASLVEQEASRDEDRPRVARVIDNRLNAPKDLQFDSTVHYAEWLKDPNYQSTLDLTDVGIDSPYNTYKHQGLPPGPICSPGAKSITAVMHPTSGPWLYFVVVNPDTGETKFATTAAEHEKNVAEYNKWMAAHPDVK